VALFAGVPWRETPAGRRVIEEKYKALLDEMYE